MKTKYFVYPTVIIPVLLGIVISLSGLVSCEDDESSKGEPYFLIEGEPTGLKVSIEATNQKYMVRSNRPWKIVAQSEQDWVKAFPNEGEDDGIFEIRVAKNGTIFTRTVDFAFIVDGKEQPVLFRVEQDEAPPALTVTPSPLVSVLASGGAVDISIDANIEWNYTLTDNSWLREPQLSPTGISFVAPVNETGIPRETILTVNPVDAQYADLKAEITVRQISERVDDGKEIGFVYFEDNFDWITAFGGPDDIKTINDFAAGFSEGSYPTSGYPPVTATLNMYSYAPAGGAVGDLNVEFTARGYTDIQPGSEWRTIYFAAHYLKFGKTNYQTGLQRTIPNTDREKPTNIRFTFDATPVITGSGNYDAVDLVVEIEGAGSVNVDDGVTKSSGDLDIRQANRTFPWTWKPLEVVLYSVTSDTKVTLKPNTDGNASGTKRYYLDNLKFVKHSVVTP